MAWFGHSRNPVNTNYYHDTNEGGYFWTDLAEEAFLCAGIHVRIERMATKKYGISKTLWQFNSRLDKFDVCKLRLLDAPRQESYSK